MHFDYQLHFVGDQMIKPSARLAKNQRRAHRFFHYFDLSLAPETPGNQSFF
jgi:hypothetical protein